LRRAGYHPGAHLRRASPRLARPSGGPLRRAIAAAWLRPTPCSSSSPTTRRPAFPARQLLAWHAELAARGGWLIVDEAFIDGDPAGLRAVGCARWASLRPAGAAVLDARADRLGPGCVGPGPSGDGGGVGGHGLAGRNTAAWPATAPACPSA
jgi:hypothetical protein